MNHKIKIPRRTLNDTYHLNANLKTQLLGGSLRVMHFYDVFATVSVSTQETPLPNVQNIRSEVG